MRRLGGQAAAFSGARQGCSLRQAPARRWARAAPPVSALHIDRAARLERVWQRQAAEVTPGA